MIHRDALDEGDDVVPPLPISCALDGRQAPSTSSPRLLVFSMASASEPTSAARPSQPHSQKPDLDAAMAKAEAILAGAHDPVVEGGPP